MCRECAVCMEREPFLSSPFNPKIGQEAIIDDKVRYGIMKHNPRSSFRYLLLSALLAIPVLLEAQTLDCATTLFAQPEIRFIHKLKAFEGDSITGVSSLPKGLSFNKNRSLVEGVFKKEGNYQYLVEVMKKGVKVCDTVRIEVSRSLQQPLPFMGWLSWNVVEGEISTDVVRKVADAMKEHLLPAGYRYLVIDDLWHAPHRDSVSDRPIEDSRKFPNGMKEAVDYVHSQGLKFGIYSDAGDQTCARMFGSYGFERQDAQQYADWGVDLLKYDYCFAPTDRETALNRYKTMGDALKATGRSILYYMCEWGQRQPWLWAHQTGATCWRTTYDTRDGWRGKWGGIGMQESVEQIKGLWPYSGVNRFNDADMMCVGIHGKGKSSSDLVERPGMTQEEYRTQFALWCMWSSPLTLSFDLRKPIAEEDLNLICNPELIAIDQDPMGLQAEWLFERDSLIFFQKELENGDVAVGIVNMSSEPRQVQWRREEIPALKEWDAFGIRDVANQRNLGSCSWGSIQMIPGHGTDVLRCYRLPLSDEIGTIPETISTQTTIGKKGRDNIEVNLMAPNGLEKRLVVYDPDGHILYQTRGKGQHFTIPYKALKSQGGKASEHRLNIVCQGQSWNVRFFTISPFCIAL